MEVWTQSGLISGSVMSKVFMPIPLPHSAIVQPLFRTIFSHCPSQFPGWFMAVHGNQRAAMALVIKTSRGITWATSSYASLLDTFHRSPSQTLSDHSNLLGQNGIMWPVLTQCKRKEINIVIIDNMAGVSFPLISLEDGYVNTIQVLLWKRKIGRGPGG